MNAWDLRKGAISMTLTGHSDTITSLAVSPDGSLLLSNSMVSLPTLLIGTHVYAGLEFDAHRIHELPRCQLSCLGSWLCTMLLEDSRDASATQPQKACSTAVCHAACPLLPPRCSCHAPGQSQAQGRWALKLLLTMQAALLHR